LALEVLEEVGSFVVEFIEADVLGVGRRGDGSEWRDVVSLGEGMPRLSVRGVRCRGCGVDAKGGLVLAVSVLTRWGFL
jgi:hypothetical protein